MKIIIPKNTIKYILFQRTHYKNKNLLFRLLTSLGNFNLRTHYYNKNLLFRLLTSLGIFNFYKISISLKAFFFSLYIKQEFNKDMIKEYQIIKPFLPYNIDSILDIGCGVAGIDILMSNHYAHKVDIFLIDKTRMDKKVYYYFEKRGSFYNSLQVSKKLLEKNGVDSKKIHLQEATSDNKITFHNKFDLIISLLSWGYHYPISIYLDEVYEKLKPNGILIIYIRKNTDSEKEIKNKFGNYKIILESGQLLRVLAKK